jgi:MinD superfamily P-loop ATPase
MVDHESGKYFISETEYGPFVHATLNIAEGNSGKLVTLIRKKPGK